MLSPLSNFKYSRRRPYIRHWKHHKNDRECLRKATNVWRSFAIITNSWRAAFVSPLAIYSLRSPCNGHTSIGRPMRTYIDQLCVDVGCLPEDLPDALQDRNGWRQKVMSVLVMMIICHNDWCCLGSDLGHNATYVTQWLLRWKAMGLEHCLVSNRCSAGTHSTFRILLLLLLWCSHTLLQPFLLLILVLPSRVGIAIFLGTVSKAFSRSTKTKDMCRLAA